MMRRATLNRRLRSLLSATTVAATTAATTVATLVLCGSVAAMAAPGAGEAAPTTPPAAARQAPKARPAPSGKTARPAQATEKPGVHWDYEGEDGPDHWGDLDPSFAACKTGKLQSPIDILALKIKPTDLDSFRFYSKAVPAGIIDNGHTIQIDFDRGNVMKVNGMTYELVQAHFHRPGEQHLNGKTFPMEVDFVYQGEDGKPAVIAALMTTGKANAVLDQVLASLPKNKGSAAKPSSISIDPTGLMPPVRTYYTYQGSLTTPPCTEGVTWFVLKDQVTISATQEEAFAKRYPHNARPIQPAVGRTIQSSE